MPSVARAELEDDPDRTVLRVLELRAYARTKAQLDRTDLPKKDRPTGPLADLVQEIEVDLWRERKARRGR